MADKVPQIAILMAAYNGMTFIEEQLHSIERQKNVNASIFISVDISTDGTYEWCIEYAQRHTQVTVLPYGDKFGGAAPNFFRLIKDVDFSGFDYVALADQDDIWLEDKLFTACSHMDKTNIEGYSSNVLAFWSDGRELLINKAQSQRKYDYLFEAAGPGCTYVMKIQPLMKFKELLISQWQQMTQVTSHDWIIYAFFRKTGYQWFIDSNITMNYRQHNNNQVGINKGWRARITRLKLFRSGWYKQQVLIISNLIEEQATIVNSRWTLLQNINQSRRKLGDRIVLFVVVVVGFY